MPRTQRLDDSIYSNFIFVKTQRKVVGLLQTDFTISKWPVCASAFLRVYMKISFKYISVCWSHLSTLVLNSCDRNNSCRLETSNNIETNANRPNFVVPLTTPTITHNIVASNGGMING